MAGWSVPLADVTVDEADIAAVADVYRSGWLSMGPRTEELEGAFATSTGERHALAVANGTAALHLICLAAGLATGDEVVVPSLTFVATVNAIAYTGATPVFADVAGLTEPWLSAAAAEAAITPRTKAVMTMAYGGHAGETAALRELCERRGLLLLEDAAHAAGSRLGGRELGVTCALAPAGGLESSHHLFAIVLDEGADRDTFRAALAERGVQTSVHYPPVHGFSIYAGARAELPVTDAYAARAVTLPLFAHMTREQQDRVIG